MTEKRHYVDVELTNTGYTEHVIDPSVFGFLDIEETGITHSWAPKGEIEVEIRSTGYKSHVIDMDIFEE